MPDIHNDDGDNIAEMSLTERQMAALEEGGEIVVIFHTPQLLRGLLGERNGSFTLHKHADRIVTNEPEAVKVYAGLQKAIASARRMN